MGTLISEDLSLVDFNDPNDMYLGRMMLFVIGPYYTMYDAWQLRLSYLGTYVAEGALHKFVDILEGLTVTVMAFSIATSSDDYLNTSVSLVT